MTSLCHPPPESEHCGRSYAGILHIPASHPAPSPAQTHPPYADSSQMVGRESTQDFAKPPKAFEKLHSSLTPRKPSSLSKISVSKQTGSLWQDFQRAGAPFIQQAYSFMEALPSARQAWPETRRRCHCSPQTREQNHDTRLRLEWGKLLVGSGKPSWKRWQLLGHQFLSLDLILI